jgi:hypothetical protein
VRAISLSNGTRSKKTFVIAAALLGAVAAAQIIGALVLYLLHARKARPASAAAVTQSARPVAAATAAPVTSPAPRSAPEMKTTAQRPGRRNTSVADEILQVAKALRGHGDTTNAIAKLQQATALAPENAEVLAELAMTYESIQLFDRSNEAWRRLQSLGPTAGPLYELADLKLRVGVPERGIPGSIETAPPEEEPQPNDSSGIPDGSDFGISQITQTAQNDPDADTKLTLRVGVKVRPSTSIDHTKVKIQVFFYDVVDNDQVVLTDADVSYEWVTSGHNWKVTDTELLDVTYLRAKRNDRAQGTAMGEATGPVPDSVEQATRTKGKKEIGAEMLPTNEGGSRQYLGYIVRVYYKDQLQAVRAEPTRLLNLFPPPFTAPPQ